MGLRSSWLAALKLEPPLAMPIWISNIRCDYVYIAIANFHIIGNSLVRTLVIVSCKKCVKITDPGEITLCDPD